MKSIYSAELRAGADLVRVADVLSTHWARLGDFQNPAEVSIFGDVRCQIIEDGELSDCILAASLAEIVWLILSPEGEVLSGDIPTYDEIAATVSGSLGPLSLGQCYSMKRLPLLDGEVDDPDNYVVSTVENHLIRTGIYYQIKEMWPDDLEINWDDDAAYEREFWKLARKHFPEQYHLL